MGIFASDEAAGARAREALELFQVEYPVEPERVEWMRREVMEISQKAGLQSTRWNQNVLELCGQRQSIEDATLLLDNHSEYFTVFEEMARQDEEIQRTYEALEVAAAAAGLGTSQRTRKQSPQRSKKNASSEGKQSPQRSKKNASSEGGRNG